MTQSIGRKKNFPTIKGSRIRLRPICSNDLECTLKWRNKPEIRRWFFNSHSLSIEQHISFFKKYIKNDYEIIYIIELNGNNLPIGQISLYNINWNVHSAEFGRLLIGENNAVGKGYANEATRLLLEFASSKLGIIYFYARIKLDNGRSICLCEKNGFIKAEQNEREVFMTLSLYDQLPH